MSNNNIVFHSSCGKIPVHGCDKFPDKTPMGFAFATTHCPYCHEKFEEPKMESKILKYLSAVRDRKCINAQGQVNFAIAKQLEEDVLILIEMVEKAADRLNTIRHDTFGTIEMRDTSLVGLAEMELIASRGSTARWGDVERKEPDVPAKKNLRIPPEKQGRATEI